MSSKAESNSRDSPFKDRVLLPASPQDDERPLAQDTGGNGGLVHQAPALRAFAATNPSLNKKSTTVPYTQAAFRMRNNLNPGLDSAFNIYADPNPVIFFYFSLFFLNSIEKL